jgi:hypothetical protein
MFNTGIIRAGDINTPRELPYAESYDSGVLRWDTLTKLDLLDHVFLGLGALVELYLRYPCPRCGHVADTEDMMDLLSSRSAFVTTNYTGATHDTLLHFLEGGWCLFCYLEEVARQTLARGIALNCSSFWLTFMSTKPYLEEYFLHRRLSGKRFEFHEEDEGGEFTMFYYTRFLGMKRDICCNGFKYHVVFIEDYTI